MLRRVRPRRRLATVMLGLVVVGSLVGACGNAASPTAVPRPSPTGSPDATATASDSPTSLPSPSQAAADATASPDWKVVVDDQFGSGLPKHWRSYEGPYRSGAHNCAIPSHATVHDGYLDLRFSYEPDGLCGPGWYSGGLALTGSSSVDARVTVRYRVVQSGDVSAHRILPMRWPDDEASWPQAGEEDFCEGESVLACSTVLHYAGNLQDSGEFPVDLTTWHTLTVERRIHAVTVSVDGVVAWTYRGDATTLPATMKHVVLQQECQATCPAGTTGSEDIQVDFVTVEVPR